MSINRPSSVTTSIFASFLALSLAANALEIRSHSATRHDRFENFPAAPSENQNSNFIADGVDLGGVGWYAQEIRRQYTLVSPMHFVGANHFRPSNSGQLRFLAQDGSVKTYEIASTRAILNSDGENTDLLLGTLEEVIPDSDQVTFQPFLSLPNEGSYSGRSLLFVGHRVASPKNLRIGAGTIGSFTNFGADPLTSGSSINRTRAFQIAYSNLIGGNDDAYAQGGDSGSPSLVAVGSRGAIVGTHTAVANATINAGLATPGSIITYDTFVPHYIEELNAIMALDGYHMTRAVPGAAQPTTTLTLTPTKPAIIRAGYPFTLDFVVENTGLIEDANNIKLAATLPSTPTTSGDLWIASTPPDEVRARRGGLATRQSSTLSLTMTAPNPGTFNSTLTLAADEFASASQALSLEIIGSYRSFSSELVDQSIQGDDDGDQIINLLEYAFNGDPAQNSQLNNGIPVLPAITRDGETVSIQFHRRKDFIDRALSYTLESSNSLIDGSWVAATPASSTLDSFNEDFEKVTATFEISESAQFFRVQVGLDEGA